MQHRLLTKASLVVTFQNFITENNDLHEYVNLTMIYMNM
jgi:hypothetical protein